MAKAKQLLAEAGYPDGKGMARLELWTHAKDASIMAQHEEIQRSLAAIGIPLELHVMETWKAYKEKILNGNRPGILFRYGWHPSFPDPDDLLYPLFHSNSVYNRGRYHNAEVDSLLEKARGEIDNLSRLALYQEAEKMIMEDAPTVNLVHYLFEYLMHPYVYGFQPSPLSLHHMPMKAIWLDAAAPSRSALSLANPSTVATRWPAVSGVSTD